MCFPTNEAFKYSVSDWSISQMLANQNQGIIFSIILLPDFVGIGFTFCFANFGHEKKLN